MEMTRLMHAALIFTEGKLYTGIFAREIDYYVCIYNSVTHMKSGLYAIGILSI